MRTKHLLTTTGMLLLTSLISLDSCKKSGSATGKTKTAYLTAAPWYLSSFDYDDNIDGTIDYTETPADCETDDTYTFGTDNILTYSPGSDLCDTSETSGTATWALTDNEGKLTFGDGSYSIKTLNDTLLRLYYDTTYSSESIRLYISFKHE